MTLVPLLAKTAKDARKEISSRWPGKDVKYQGYDINGQVVFLSLVRGASKGAVATARRNRSLKPVAFDAEVK